MDTIRRDVLAGLGAFIASAATGQQTLSNFKNTSQKKEAVDLSFLSPEWQKKFSKVKLDEWDVQILKNICKDSDTRFKDTGLRAFYLIASHRDWPDVDSRIKEKCVIGFLNKHQPALTPNRLNGSIVCGDVFIGIRGNGNGNGHLTIVPATLNERTVWGWEKRPERTEDYITLPDKQLEKLSAEDRAWAKRFEGVVNDLIHGIRTWPNQVPSQADIKSGAVNAMAVAVGNSFFSKDAHEHVDYSVLEKLPIPSDQREMYDLIGVYIFRESDLNGQYVGGIGCDQKPLVYDRGDIVGACSFNNGMMPVPSGASNVVSAFARIQKERQSNTAFQFLKRVKALSNDKTLTSEQRAICKLAVPLLDTALRQQDGAVWK